MLGEELAFEDGRYVFIEEPYPVPLLSIDNEEHHKASEEGGNGYVNVFVLENALDGNNTWFKGSGHMNFTDLPLLHRRWRHCWEPEALTVRVVSVR